MYVVPWRGEPICNSLETGAKAWCSLERGVGACGALWRSGHEPTSPLNAKDFIYTYMHMHA